MKSSVNAVGFARPAPMLPAIRGVVLALALVVAAREAAGERSLPVSILVYHRFGPTVADSMTVTTATFEAQLRYLSENGRTVIPLRRLVEARLGHAPPPPPGAVVITADDGHRSVYDEMLPLVRRFGVPVTLFIYPSAISNADYALTWEQLRGLRDSGLFDVQSHTYWHPNFHTEKARLPPVEYERFVRTQLVRSRATLERELGTKVDLLAWPFGICDRDLIEAATQAGYVAALALDGRVATSADDPMALPRHLMTEQYRGAAFGRLLRQASER